MNENTDKEKCFMRMSTMEIMYNLGIFIKDLHALNLKETLDEKEVKELLSRGSLFHKHMFE